MDYQEKAVGPSGGESKYLEVPSLIDSDGFGMTVPLYSSVEGGPLGMIRFSPMLYNHFWYVCWV